MNRLRANVLPAALVAAMMLAGCHKNVSAQNQSNDLGPDPAAANMAPGNAMGDATDTSATQQPAPAGQGTNEAITAAQTAQPTADQSAPDQNDQAVNQGYAAVDDSNDIDYSDSDAQADQAPPPMPEYVQPPLPEDGYIWTPGYWAWSPQGYYWVPGAWVMPPYEGALWTPAWWGFHGGRYYYFRGYWGHYIGYYGGINYGFGYGGRGYEGGYWRGNRFQYNRTVNVIHITNITNVYVHNVTVTNNRASYNGPGGARLRPAPAEIAAMRGPRVAPMSTQLQAQRAAQQDRGQFANVNHGRPAAVVAPRPIQADRQTQALPPARIQQPQRQPNAPQNFARPGQPQPNQPQQQPNQWQRGNQMQGSQSRPAPQQPQQNRPALNQPQQARPVPQQPNPPQQNQQRPAQNFNRPAQQQPAQPQQRPESFARPAQPAAPQTQPGNLSHTSQPVGTAQPATQPQRSFPMQQQPTQQQQVMQQPRPAQPEQQRPENFSRPAPQPAPQPQPQRQFTPPPQAAPRPAPTPRPAPAPAPRPAPAPENRGDDRPH